MLKWIRDKINKHRKAKEEKKPKIIRYKEKEEQVHMPGIIRELQYRKTPKVPLKPAQRKRRRRERIARMSRKINREV